MNVYFTPPGKIVNAASTRRHRATGHLFVDRQYLLIDGTNYTGSETSFSIVTSANYTELLNSYSVTGFGTEGVDWELIQTLGTTDGGIGLRLCGFQTAPGSGSRVGFAVLA